MQAVVLLPYHALCVQPSVMQLCWLPSTAACVVAPGKDRARPTYLAHNDRKLDTMFHVELASARNDVAMFSSVHSRVRLLPVNMQLCRAQHVTSVSCTVMRRMTYGEGGVLSYPEPRCLARVLGKRPPCPASGLRLRSGGKTHGACACEISMGWTPRSSLTAQMQMHSLP